MAKKPMKKKGMHKMPGGMMMADSEMQGMMPKKRKAKKGKPKKK
jgi:hypothetical protein